MGKTVEEQEERGTHWWNSKWKLIGSLEVATGVYGLGILITSFLGADTISGSLVALLFILVIPVLYVIAGMGLWREKRWALWASLILQWIAIIDFRIGEKLSFYLMPGIEFNISLSFGSVEVSIDLFALLLIILIGRLIEAEKEAKNTMNETEPGQLELELKE